MNIIQQQKEARLFADEWQGKGYEKGETQKFWLELIQKVLGNIDYVACWYKKAAETPYLFGEIRQPDTDMLVVPKVSSETRRYIPISFVSKETIINGSALLIPNATLYAFGVLISNVHNAWMRVVAGRLETRYQYSANIVYNNFPWPFSGRSVLGNSVAEKNFSGRSVLGNSVAEKNSTAEKIARISQTAQAILDAHQDNDRAVMAAYGFSTKMTESECIAELFKLYQKLTLIENNKF